MSRGLEIKNIFNIFKRKNRHKRTFEAGVPTRTHSGWLSTSQKSYDSEVEQSLSGLRDYARDAEKNNDIIRRYLSLVPHNVLGSEGFRLECRFKDDRGNILNTVNRQIEEAWQEFCEVGTCTVDGKLSFTEVCRLNLTSTIRDGEAFNRLVYGQSFNRFGFALNLIDASLCDETLNAEKPSIKMGVELDMWGKPKSYHFKTKHDHLSTTSKNLVIPATHIIHLYRQDRMQQTRGLSWIRSKSIRDLQKYYESELTASRVASSKMGFFRKKTDNYADDIGNIEEGNDNSEFPVDAVPGSFEIIPEGWELQEWNPNSPQSNFDSFVRSQMQAIACGLGVSYASLSNDLRNNSYSSIRTGMIEERTTYKVLQKWFAEHYILPVYQAWLKAAILNGALDIPFSDYKRYRKPLLQGKVHEWIDPLRDMKGHIAAIQAGVKSKSQVVREIQGAFYEDVISDKVSEKILEKEMSSRHGIAFEDDVYVPDNAGDYEDGN